MTSMRWRVAATKRAYMTLRREYGVKLRKATAGVACLNNGISR